LNAGALTKPRTCAGCKGRFTTKYPEVHVCKFAQRGFPWLKKPGHAAPCGVRYHARCITVGVPFTSRLDKGEGLFYPWQAPMPHYVCGLCSVRAHVDRELFVRGCDLALLMVERVRQVDYMGGWSLTTLKKYGPYLWYLRRFEARFDVQVLDAQPLVRPPTSPAYTLNWAEQLYALRTTRGRDGEFNRIRFATVRQIRSAASWYYTQAMSMRYPGQVMRDRFRRGMVMPFISPTDKAMTTLTASGMARRLGTEVKKSWALSYVHIAFIDRRLQQMYRDATDRNARHELTVAASVNLLAYLGWLRSTETFDADANGLTQVPPEDGPTRGLAPSIGAIELRLLAATKSDRTITADCIIAWTCLSGLSLGNWLTRLKAFDSAIPNCLFSTKLTPVWTSQHFRDNFAYPLLELQRASGEPTLRAFSDKKGHRIRDKVYSMHSWRRAGRSRVSRTPRHDEPNPKGTRMATPTEVYEHGRWQVAASSENMPRHYNQWDLADRIGVTLFCM
jgi:hypothetical protein